MTKYFTYEESVQIQQAFSQMEQAITAALLRHNGEAGKHGTEWRTGNCHNLARRFYLHAKDYYSSVWDDPAAEEDLVDTLALGMMLLDRIQMTKALEGPPPTKEENPYWRMDEARRKAMEVNG